MGFPTTERGVKLYLFQGPTLRDTEQFDHGLQTMYAPFVVQLRQHAICQLSNAEPFHKSRKTFCKGLEYCKELA